jgi:hypothetical protein
MAGTARRMTTPAVTPAGRGGDKHGDEMSPDLATAQGRR